MPFCTLSCLKVISRDVEVLTEFDGYLYFDLKIEDDFDSVSRSVYWRLVDPLFNLVEIGMSESSGQLKSITIPLYNGWWQALTPESSTMSEIYGLPIFSISNSGKQTPPYVDVPGRCQFELGQNVIRIVLFADLPLHTRVLTGRLTCELDEQKRLCAIRLRDLSSDEISVLRRQMNVSQSQAQD